MASLLAYMSRNRRLKREDLASGAIAFLLQHPAILRGAFINGMRNEFGCSLPRDFRVETQKGYRNLGRPDIDVCDRNGSPLLRIECKFDANFTRFQLDGSYLKNFVDEGLLLFVVPPARLAEVKSEIAKSYKLPHSDEGRWQYGNLKVAITTWRNLLLYLEIDPDYEKNQSQTATYLSDLRSICEVNANLSFVPFRKSQLDSHQGRYFADLLWLAFQIAETMDSLKQKGNFGGAWYESGTGRDGSISGFNCWLGIEADYWAKHGHPIWIAFDERGNDFKIGDAKLLGLTPIRDEYDYLWIPIELTAGMQGEDLLKNAGERILQLKKELRNLKT